MILLRLAAIAAIFSLPYTAATQCAKGDDYGIGDCLEPHSELLDRLSAERVCRNNGMVLYYPYNAFVASQIRQIAVSQFTGDSVWIGITCSNRTTCYNDRGGLLTPGKNYTVFVDIVKEPCFYFEVNQGLWFGDACRGDLKRSFICWYTGDKTDPNCPPGTFFYNNRCYGLHGVQDPQAASDHCHDMGGELVSIHSSIQNDYVWYLAYLSIPDDTNYGIGMYVDGDDNKKWYDGSDTGFTFFGTPDTPPDDGIYPPVNSTIYVLPTTKKWMGDATRQPIPQVCSWSAYTYDLSNVKQTFPNYCGAGTKDGVLPMNAIIYSPNYPNYTQALSCSMVYKGDFGDVVQIIFTELYLDKLSQILIYTDPTDTTNYTPVTYDSSPTTIYTSNSGYMRVVFIAPKGQLNYWRATTIPQGERGMPAISLGKASVCDPTKTLALNTKTSSQFQTLNYNTHTGMQYPCLITITAQSATSTVAVSFYDFYLGPDDEFIIIDGALTSSVQEIVLKGPQPGLRIESTGQKLSFKIMKVSPGFRGIWADFTSN